MKLKRDAKFGEELTRRFKIGIGIWQMLTLALKSLKNFHFNGFLLSKVYIVWAKKYRGVVFHETEEGYKEKLTCCLVNDVRNSAIFHQSTRKCQNWNFDKTLLSKLENLHRSYVSWQWIIIQKLKRNWLVNLKLTRGTSQILTRALEIHRFWPEHSKV